jgi:hypothetical protein
MSAGEIGKSFGMWKLLFFYYMEVTKDKNPKYNLPFFWTFTVADMHLFGALTSDFLNY